MKRIDMILGQTQMYLLKFGLDFIGNRLQDFRSKYTMKKSK